MRLLRAQRAQVVGVVVGVVVDGSPVVVVELLTVVAVSVAVDVDP